jgi:hypothetical protein
VVSEVMVVVVCFSRVTKAMVAGGGVVVSEVMAVVVWFSRATTAMVAGVGGVGRGMVSVMRGGCDNIVCVASETREVAAMAVPAVVLGMLPSLPVGIKCDGFMHTPCNARSDCLC